MSMITVSPAPPEMEFAVRWTRDDCEALEAAGFLNHRYELMNGWIIRSPPRLLREAMTVGEITASLRAHWGYEHLVTLCGMMVAPDENEFTCPAPDVMVLSKSGRAICGNYPYPEDILLLIEVSDTTLDYDLVTNPAFMPVPGCRSIS